MTKSLIKHWTGGLNRLLHAPSQAQALSQGLEAAAEAVAELIDTAAAPVAQTGAAPLAPDTPRESLVRPRSAAWAAGEWTRGEFPLPSTPGRAVQQLSYGLYVPPGKDAEGLPLVVMLHGCQQNIDQFAQGTRMNLLADRYGFAVLYPEQSSRAHLHGCWHWYERPESAGAGEVRGIVDLVDDVTQRYGFDKQSVYVAGLSAGAGLAGWLALHYPDRFAAVALHSGPAFGEAHSGIGAMDVMRRGLREDPVAVADAVIEPGTHAGMPALILHGDGDTVVAPKNAEQLAVEYLRLNQMADTDGISKGVQCVESREEGVHLTDYLDRKGRPVVRLCKVDGLGHAWAGGDETVPFHTAAGPDASEMTWRFFAENGKKRKNG